MNRDLGYIDTAALALLALGALACITAYGIACVISWCVHRVDNFVRNLWSIGADLAGDACAGCLIGVPVWLWIFEWAERIA